MKNLCRLLSYDSNSGLITWKLPRGKKIKNGDTAGYVNRRGYRVIGFEGKSYFAHRIAAHMSNLDIEGMDIDHINGNRDDNRLCNLRVVSRHKNLKNKSIQSNSTTGVNGVCIRFRGGNAKYYSAIKVDGVSYHLGSFSDKWDAICARMSANNHHSFHHNHGHR